MLKVKPGEYLGRAGNCRSHPDRAFLDLSSTQTFGLRNDLTPGEVPHQPQQVREAAEG